MKKLLVTLLSLGLVLGAYAQNYITTPSKDVKTGLIEAHPTFESLLQKNVRGYLNKKDTTRSIWYNYTEAARTFGGKTIRGFSNTFIFPDSLPKQIYGDGAGGTLLNNIGLHAAGEMFDFKTLYFDADTLLGYNNSFSWDSVAFAYNYTHNIPNSVDTLLVQYFYNGGTQAADEGIIGLTFSQSGKRSAGFELDTLSYLGKKAFKIDTVLLTASNNTNDTLRTISLKVGKTLPQRSIVAFYVMYKPGYSYALNDTLDSRWDNPKPTKLLNNFRLYQVEETPISSLDRSYNWGLFLYRFLKYRPSGNTGGRKFVQPGNADNTNHDHIWSAFQLSATYNSIDEASKKDGYGVSNVYPNPTTNFGFVDVTMPKSGNASLTITNLLGQRVASQELTGLAQGRNTLTLPIASLQNGVYFYTIQSGNYTVSKKFTVSR